jgi:penicillin-binding protein 1A
MDSTNSYNPVPVLTLREKFRLIRFRHRKPLRIVGAILAGLVLLLTVGGSALYANFTAGLPDVTKLDQYDPARTTKIFAADGTLIATLFDENRTYSKYEDIAPVMLGALVSIEDRRFFTHDGVDFKGLARAVLGNTTSGQTEQGASTLTMQLARRLFLTEERTYARKMREAVLAYRIDQQYSKEKILEMYLNEVYFGSGAYGIDSAAAVYFKRNPDKLEVWQAAMLAGLVQAPTAFSPLVDKKAALRRTDEVLQAMLREGKITAAQVKEAQRKAVAYRFVDRPLASADGMLKYPYFSTFVIRELSEQFPDHYIKRGGLQVVTNLDIPLQEAAERAVRQSLEGPGRALGADTGAVVVIDNANGDLVAMVGGPGWSSSMQYNAAWQTKRQPGSSFKMFIYAAALEAGYTPEHEFADTLSTFSPGTQEQWTPANSDGTFMGAIPLRTGLQFSRNLVSAKLVAHLGPGRIVDLAHRMGLDDDLPRVASLALGAGEVTPLQMARAFSALPTGGILRPAYPIKKVTTAEGEVLKTFSGEAEEDRVLSLETATQVCEMLHRVVTGGTAQGADIAGTYVAGKTGTTDNFKDAWFTGFTPHHTVAVWIGRNDNKPMQRVYGGTLPADIFHTVAKAALAGHKADAALPGVQFVEPQRVELCWDSTYLAGAGCQKKYWEVFKAGVVPTRQCPTHRQVLLPQTVTTLTNVDSGLDPALNRSRPTPAQAMLAKVSIPDELNPRKDDEVVGRNGALIPYVEKAPGMPKVTFVVQAAPRSNGPQASPTPTLDDRVEAVTPTLTEVDSTADEDPATGTGATVRTTAPLIVEPEYPTSSGTNVRDEVIYQPAEGEAPSEGGDPVIPPDTATETESPKQP